MDKKLFKNYSYNLLYQIFAIIVPLISTPYVSRILNPEGIGIYSYTYTIVYVFTLFVALGIRSYGQREIAYRKKDITECNKIFWELCIIKAALGIIVSVIYFIFSVNYTGYTFYLFMQYFLILAEVFDVSWYFQGMEDFKITAIRNISVKIIATISIFIFVRSETDTWKYILINSLSTFLSNAVLIINLRNSVHIVKFNQLNFKRHFKEIIEFFVPLIAVQIYSHVDKLMLGVLLQDNVQSGYYEQARKISNLLVTVFVALNSVMYSRISYLYMHRDSKTEIVCMYQKVMKIIWVLLIPITLGLYFVSEDFVLCFFGSNYEYVSYLLKISCPLIIFSSLGNFVGQEYLNPMGLQNRSTFAYIISAIVNIILNAILIPLYGASGALFSSVISEFMSYAIQMFMLKRSEFNFQICKGLWKPLLSGCVMVVIIIILKRFVSFTPLFNTLLYIFIGAFVYLFTLYLLKDNIFEDIKNMLVKR